MDQPFGLEVAGLKNVDYRINKIKHIAQLKSIEKGNILCETARFLRSLDFPDGHVLPGFGKSCLSPALRWSLEITEMSEKIFLCPVF